MEGGEIGASEQSFHSLLLDKLPHYDTQFKVSLEKLRLVTTKKTIKFDVARGQGGGPVH